MNLILLGIAISLSGIGFLLFLIGSPHPLPDGEVLGLCIVILGLAVSVFGFRRSALPKSKNKN